MLTATKKTLNKIEGFGLMLVLISFCLQMFQNDLENSKQESENYHLNKKLDYIWTIVEKQYSEDHPEDGVHMAINFKAYDEDWKIYSEQRKELKFWEEAIDICSNIYIWIFIAGSILLIVPKFIEER